MEKPRILLVDDEQNIRLLARRYLSNDFTVLEASDGQEAVNIACQHEPDLIFMDILMPKKDGYTACSIIKAHKVTKRIPVVMFTALGYEHNKELAKEAGADGYMTKPFTEEALLDTISKFLPKSRV